MNTKVKSTYVGLVFVRINKKDVPLFAYSISLDYSIQP